MALILEACVESVTEALFAEQKGANRIELCSRLDLDGLTPNKKLIVEVINRVRIPVKVMIRPKAGDFVYTAEELSIMKEDIGFCKQLGVQGIVFGILDKTGKLNLDQIQQLAAYALPLEVTIHKAIDQTPDPIASVAALREIENISSVLTSGGAHNAFEGHKVIKEMLQAAGESIHIIAAGNITKSNLAELHYLIGASDYHGRRIVGELS